MHYHANEFVIYHTIDLALEFFHLILLASAVAKDHGANIFILLNISALLTDVTKTMICYRCDRVDGLLVSKVYDSGEAREGRDGVSCITFVNA